MQIKIFIRDVFATFENVTLHLMRMSRYFYSHNEVFRFSIHRDENKNTANICQ